MAEESKKIKKPSELEMLTRLGELETDDRLVEYSAEHVMVNAPLAIIQITLKAEANTLRWVLGLPQRQYFGKD